MKRLRSHIADPSVKVVTFDIFDTVLMRNTKPEIARFFETACEQSRELEKRGIEIPAEQLFHARMLCTPIAYRSARMNRFEREARFVDIASLVCETLGLCDPAIHTLLEDVEVAYEKRNLRGNADALHALADARAKGKKIYFLSDMYLSAKRIEELLSALLPELQYDGGYSSSDHSLTKHAGGLFDLFCEREGVKPEDIVHIGDNHQSDHLSPVGKGIRTVHIPRTRLFYAIRDLRQRHARFTLRRHMP